MGAVTYPDSRVSEFVNENAVPVQVLYNSRPLADDYNVQWTPTILTLDSSGKEHHRIVGFLPPEEFIAAQMLGMAKVYFDTDQIDQALSWLDRLLSNYPDSAAAPEAIYLRGVSLYKKTHEGKHLKEAYEELQARHPTSEWAKRAAPYRLL